jgi:hypothetical protein
MNKRAPTTIDDDGECVARTEQRMNKRAPTTTKNKEEKETKKPKKQSPNDIAESMERYINMKEKHFDITESMERYINSCC